MEDLVTNAKGPAETHLPNSPSHSHALTNLLPSAAQLELVQEVNRLKLTPHEGTIASQELPTSPRLSISSILPALHPTFVTPQSRRRPPRHIQQGQLSVPSASGSSIKQGLVAQFQHMKGKERVGFKRSGQLQSKKHGAAWTRVTQKLRGPFGFGTGSSPYEMVEKALTELKEFINHLSSSSVSSGTSNDGSTALGSKSCMDVYKKAGWTVEEVIDMVDDYLNSISRTASGEEMEEGLLVIQRRVGVNLLPTWYGLLRTSYIEFWKRLNKHFESHTLKFSFREMGDHLGSWSSDPKSSAP